IVLQRWSDDREWIGRAAVQLFVRLEGCHDHPVERKEHDNHQHDQGDVYRHPTARHRLQEIHPAGIPILILFFHLSSPRCQARRCNPKYENVMDASRKGIIMMANAEPSPSAPPEMAL